MDAVQGGGYMDAAQGGGGYMDAAQGGAVSKIPETSWLLPAFPKANFTLTRTLCQKYMYCTLTIKNLEPYFNKSYRLGDSYLLDWWIS